MNGITAKCQKCGGELELVDTYLSMQTFRCKKCGNESHIHFSMGSEDIKGKYSTGVDLSIQWNDDLSKKDAMYLRNIFPEFKKYAVKELIEKWRHEKELYLGYYQKEKASELCREAQKAGLDVREATASI